MLRGYTDKIVILKSGMRNKQRNLTLDMIKSFSNGEQFIILANGKYIGEGNVVKIYDYIDYNY